MVHQHSPNEADADALLTTRSLLGSLLFGAGFVALAALPVGLVLWVLDVSSVVLVIAAILVLPAIAAILYGGTIMYRSLRPHATNAKRTDPNAPERADRERNQRPNRTSAS